MEIRLQEGHISRRVSSECPGVGCWLRVKCAFVSLGLGEFLERGAQVSGPLGEESGGMG